MKVLIIDNYDSFVYNLAQYVGELGAHPQVFRNDKLTLKQAQGLEPDRIIISPGPGNPEACTWNPPERRRLLGDLQIRVELKPGAWRAFRFVPATKQPASQATAKS